MSCFKCVIHCYKKALSVTVVFALCAGCVSTPFRQATVSHQDEAGSTHMAVLSITPWNEIADALQPNFSIDEKTALDRALPVTGFDEEKFYNAIGARLLLAPPRTGTTSETVTSSGGSGTPTSVSETTTDTTEPGDASAIQPFGSYSTNRAASLPPAADKTVIDKSSLKQDAMLQHLAATAIFQEIKLLNTYVKNVALRTGYQAYVVRLQVNLMPAGRAMPYDAYATLSFFNDSDKTNAPTPATYATSSIKTLSLESSPSMERFQELLDSIPGDSNFDELRELVKEYMRRPSATVLACIQKELARIAHSPESQDEVPSTAKLPVVVPLLVTDSIEGVIAAKSLEQTREFMLGFAALMNGFSATFNLNSYMNSLQTYLTNEIGSVYTVSRLSDNTVRMRFGAQRVGPSQYAMVPRNHNVTLLVLVDEAQFCGRLASIDVVNKTDFVNARTGVQLPTRTPMAAVTDALVALSRYGLDPKREQAEELLFASQQNDMNKFREILTSCDSKFLFTESAWVDLLAVRVGSRYSSATLEVVKPLDKVEPYKPNAEILFIDDGKILVSPPTRLGKGLHGSGLQAWICAEDRTAASPSSHTYAADVVEVRPGGDTVVLKFASPKALFGKDTAFRASKVFLKQDKPELDAQFGVVVLSKQEDANEKKGFEVNLPSLILNRCTTPSNLIFDLLKLNPKDTGTYFLTIDTPVEPGITKFVDQKDPKVTVLTMIQANKWKIENPGTVVMPLSNGSLSTSRDIRIGVITDKNASIDSKTIRVVQEGCP